MTELQRCDGCGAHRAVLHPITVKSEKKTYLLCYFCGLNVCRETGHTYPPFIENEIKKESKRAKRSNR